MVGIKGRFQVSARNYYPWKDIAFIGYIARAPSQKPSLAPDENQTNQALPSQGFFF
jgi:hypothetical protein